MPDPTSDDPQRLRAEIDALEARLSDLTAQSVSEQAQLRASLAEKELLLREVHHRVKNNLQVITSLLSLQRRYAKTSSDRAALEDMYNRVSAMALVHEELNLGTGDQRVEFRRYTKRLVGSLLLIYAEGGISHHLHLDAPGDFWVDLDTAVTLGLLLNEAVSNTFKHAFDPGTPGDITVRLRQDEGRLCVTIADNGRGFPEGFSPEGSKTLGMSLMSSLVQQMGGSLEVRSERGAQLHFVFPVDVRVEGP